MTSLESDQDGYDDELMGALVYQSSQTAKVRASHSDVDAGVNESFVTSEEDSLVPRSSLSSDGRDGQQLRRQLTVSNKDDQTRASTSNITWGECQTICGEKGSPDSLLPSRESYQRINEQLLLKLKTVEQENECLKGEINVLIRKERTATGALAALIVKNKMVNAAPAVVQAKATLQPPSPTSRPKVQRAPNSLAARPRGSGPVYRSSAHRNQRPAPRSRIDRHEVVICGVIAKPDAPERSDVAPESIAPASSSPDDVVVDPKSDDAPATSDAAPPKSFLLQLAEMLENADRSCTGVIQWKSTSNKGLGRIEVHSPDRLSGELLGRYFGSSSFRLFQRQMDSYGFRKVGGSNKANGKCWYVHDDITTDMSSLLLLKRKRRKIVLGNDKEGKEVHEQQQSTGGEDGEEVDQTDDAKKEIGNGQSDDTKKQLGNGQSDNAKNEVVGTAAAAKNIKESSPMRQKPVQVQKLTIERKTSLGEHNNNQVDNGLLHLEPQANQKQQNRKRHNEIDRMIEIQAKYLQEQMSGSSTNTAKRTAGRKRKESSPTSEEAGLPQTFSVNGDGNAAELNRPKIQKAIFCCRAGCAIYDKRGQPCPHHWTQKDGATEDNNNMRPAEESTTILNMNAGGTTMLNGQLPPAHSDDFSLHRLRGLSKSGDPIPSFLHHLVDMLEVETNQDIIEWSKICRGTIRVYDPKRLEEEILGRYFRGSKYSSFQRQMNYFGFSKVMIAGKGHMSPCDFVNDVIASGDVRCILLLKKRRKVRSSPEKPSMTSVTNFDLSRDPWYQQFSGFAGAGNGSK